MSPIRVVLLYDEAGWAWHHRAIAVQQSLPDEDLQITVRRRGDPIDPTTVDFVVMFGPYHVHALAGFRPSQVIIGASTPLEVSSLDWALTNGLCVAGLVNSREMFDRLANPGSVHLCENGVDPDLFRPNENATPGRHTACWVGNSRSQNAKGLDLIRAACDATATPLRIWDALAEPGAKGILPPSEIRDRIYHQSTFYVCMSELEGTPNPALEALACGLPVISTRVGNMPELLVDDWNGLLIDRSFDALCGAICRLVSLDAMQLRANARASVLNGWTWAQQAQKYARMFRDARQRLEDGRSRLTAHADQPLTPEALQSADSRFWRLRQEYRLLSA